RSRGGIAAIAASAAFSSFAPRASAFRSWAYAFAAARSSAVHPSGVLPGALVRLAVLFFFAVFFSAIPAPPVSVPLLDADQVARRIAERAVADPVRLVGRFLYHLGVGGLEALERRVDVAGGQVDARERALGHHLRDHAMLVLVHAGRGVRRVEDDGGVGLVGGAGRGPVEGAVLHGG